jgi:short-subunit dehydrogenase
MPTPEAALKNFSAVIVTGGSSGIGKSFIELIAKFRPDLAFCNLSRRRPDIPIPQLNLRHIACDLSDALQVEKGLAEIRDFLAVDVPAGRILLINNSGFGVYGQFPEGGVAQQLEMVDLNVRAVLHLTGSLLPVMKDRGGVILSVASVAAFQPVPYLGAYSATKAFVLHWSLALDEELRGSGVRALAVCPGPTSTDFSHRAGLKDGMAPDAFSDTSEDVVMASLRALAAGKSMVVTGWKNKLLAAVGSKFPKPFVSKIAGRALAYFRMKQAKP